MILRSALRIIDADGVQSLSMRKLAADLGVNPMSIYHHVANKAALLDGVTRLVTDGARHIEVSGGTWQEQLRQLAYEFRTLSLAHSNLIRHAFSVDDVIQRDGPMWRTLCAVLRGAGLPEPEVERTGAVLAVLVGGLLHTEVNGTMRRLIGEGEADDTGFSLAVDLLIDGVAARV
ncbi:AcrR family transcriptional regulator [Actinoplanes lutulentus]|uniref:TetR family transcriptional regulator n=1 Tax=Actinoplanes lutulentus TaxID=1287878 RepID=A0A327ZE27_9ACTN|nr:TetR/AcrR family transcriptional regulator [Actinoplanes lutulentus]MBB2942950.1 AcrR family transcriptional regulator [Actinoplanes lutulentus]RAK38528.1 TetR family transcriptional regulator [Actinoplanes lutulentus]